MNAIILWLSIKKKLDSSFLFSYYDNWDASDSENTSALAASLGAIMISCIAFWKTIQMCLIRQPHEHINHYS